METFVWDNLRPIRDTLLFALKHVSCIAQSDLRKMPGAFFAPKQRQINMAAIEMESSFVEATIDNETLMACIQNYHCIYDKTCNDYRVPQKKQNTWKEIAEKLQLSVEEVQKRYNSTVQRYACLLSL